MRRPRNTSGGMCRCGRGPWVAGQRKCRYCRADWARTHRANLKLVRQTVDPDKIPRLRWYEKNVRYHRFQNTLTDADLDLMAAELAETVSRVRRTQAKK